MSWTEERIELLSRLWMEGKSASQISQALGAGLSRNAVIGKVHRLGLSGRAKSTSSVSGPPASSRPRASQPRRSSARNSSEVGVGESGGGGVMAAIAPVMGNGGAGQVVHGNTVMLLSPPQSETLVQTALARLEQDVVVPLSLRVTIVDLKETMCKWPLGDPTSNEFRYCGSPSPAASPYCAHHGKLAYQPAQDRRRERERDRRTMIAR